MSTSGVQEFCVFLQKNPKLCDKINANKTAATFLTAFMNTAKENHFNFSETEAKSFLVELQAKQKAAKAQPANLKTMNAGISQTIAYPPLDLSNMHLHIEI